VPSNLAADYLLTADGKYTTRIYRKNYDEGVLEGFVTETGVDFIVNLDYNHFKEVFQKKKKEQSNEKTQ
jgi:translocation and assembly module TamB